MTQTPKRRQRRSGDEGAVYTAAVMAEVKRRRLAQAPPWTADRLAAEVAAWGVPWTRNTVVNLETGRRKWLTAHELLTLAFVLNIDSPVDLLAPLPPGVGRRVPVTPTYLAPAQELRDWCERRTGPLLQLVIQRSTPAHSVDQDHLKKLLVEEIEAGRLGAEGIDDTIRFLGVWYERMRREEDGRTDGQD
jgi:hypothetical protein